MPHGKVNLDDADEIAEELEQGDRTYWKPADGRNRIRIMPPWSEEVSRYFFATGFHYNIGPDEQSLPCPRLAKVREDCWLCHLADRLRKSSDEDDQAEAKELYARKKFLMNIVDLDHPEKGVQIWAAGIKAMKEVHYYVRDREYGDITDPEEGYNLTVQKSGSGLNTEYLVKADKRSSPFPTDELLDKNGALEDVLDELPDLTAFLTYPSDGEMKSAYEGTSKGESAEVEKEERRERRPSSRRGKEERPGRSGRPRFDDEKEPEDPEEGEDAEEPEEKSQARRSGTREGRERPATRETGGQLLSRALRTRRDK